MINLNATNFGQTKLAQAIDASTTIIVVEEALNVSPPFRIACEQEIMEVTAVEGTTWTVTRGLENTTAASHPAGASVTVVFTAEMYEAIVAELDLLPDMTQVNSGSYFSGRGKTFKQALIDDLNGAKPDGWSSASEETYGLVQSGSNLVVTVRNDDVPFDGVRSFAVETSTTNCFGEYANTFDANQTLFYPQYLASGKTWQDCWDNDENAYHCGEKITVYKILTSAIDLGFSTTEDTEITITWEQKAYLWFFTVYYSPNGTHFTVWNKDTAYTVTKYHNCSLAEWESTYGLHLQIDGRRLDRSNPPDYWKRIGVTFRVPANTRYVAFVWDFFNAKYYNTQGGWIRNFQVEGLSFPTSFMVGTRPTGKLYFPLSQLGFDPAYDEWVIAYWKKPTSTHDNTQSGSNACALGYYTEDNSVGYIWWGKDNDSNTFKLNVVYSDGTTASDSSSTFDANWYFNNWHFEVVRKTSNTLEYWIDGIKRCSISLSTSLKAFTEGLYVGGDKESPAHNALFANLYWGKAKDKDGNLIWTDEFIQRLYQHKRPFLYTNKGDVGIDDTTNSDVIAHRALLLPIDTRSVEMTYANDRISQVVEKDGSSVISAVSISYNADGTVNTLAQIAGGKTVTYTFNYTAGKISGITKSVS